VVDDTCHWSIIAGKLECASVHIVDGHQGVSPCNIDNRLCQLFLIRLALVLRSNYAQKLRYDAKNTTRSKTGELRYSGKIFVRVNFSTWVALPPQGTNLASSLKTM